MSNFTIENVRRSLFRKVRRAKADQDGVAAIEFAIVGPVFLLSVIGLIEVSMMILVSVLLESGIRDASRFGLTGQDGADGLSREEQIIESVRESTLGLVDLEADQIETLIYESFQSIGMPEEFVDDSPANGSYDPGEAYTDTNGNGQWDPDQGRPGSGLGDEIVLYRVNAEWEALTPLFSPFLGDDGVLDLEASVVIQNEPF